MGSLNVDYNLYVDKEPPDDGTARVTKFSVTSGGHAGNCAAALARLGFHPTLFTAVGDDAEGEAMLAELAADGVCPDLAVRVGGAATGRVFIPSYPDRRHMLMYRGATEQWTPESCTSVPMAEFDAVVLFDPPELVSLAVLDAAATVGIPVYWNPCGLHAGQPWTLQAASRARWLSVNRSEFTAMFGVPAEEHRVQEACQRHRIPRLVVTRGDLGALATDGSELLSTASLPLRLVDATGAGDAFAAGFIAAELLGRPWPVPLSWGVAAGSHAVTGPGARDLTLTLPWLQNSGISAPALAASPHPNNRSKTTA
ncbi:PfkB family carbohydrate kinase [Streptomyces tirandamycinicus]|uniref:carbohydrate kinase family protein n=1 Tax=Streptomyces tirandamycinicus TaxID=2174846 RepID=UPI00342BD550